MLIVDTYLPSVHRDEIPEFRKWIDEHRFPIDWKGWISSYDLGLSPATVELVLETYGYGNIRELTIGIDSQHPDYVEFKLRWC